MIKTIKMKAILLFGVLLLCSKYGFNQSEPNKSIIVDIEEVEENIYSAAVFNKGDSVLCLLLPKGFSLKNDSVPIPLVPYDEKDGKTIYNIFYSKEYSMIDGAIGSYEGVCILPYQAVILNFEIEPTEKDKNLRIDYFLKKDYYHSRFKKEIGKRGWHKKYKLDHQYIGL